jgi:hypothetical protein
MESQEQSFAVVALACRVDCHASPGQIADAVEHIWAEIDEALFPVIGHRGVAALYQRSLFVAGREHKWMMKAYEGVRAEINLPALRIALIQQTNTNAAAGCSMLLQTFHEIVISLVGALLCERLLRSVWANTSSGTSAQDSSQCTPE